MKKINFHLFNKPKKSTLSIVHGKKTTIDGIKFDSETEAKRYLVLRDMQNKGLIEKLECHPQFKLFEKFKLRDKHLSPLFSGTGKTRESLKAGTIKFDFVYLEKGNDRVVVEDVKFKGWDKNKGAISAAIKREWKWKVRLWLLIYQDEYELRIT
jgi:hypothetical protein